MTEEECRLKAWYFRLAVDDADVS